MSDDRIREVLGSEVYARAFDKVMTGTEAGLLTDEERAALTEARQLTSTPAPGYPMPLHLDSSRGESA